MVVSRTRPGGTNITSGSIGGAAGGFAMIPFFVLASTMMGMPPMAILAGIGIAFGATTDSAVAVGIVMHFVASVLIGMIFGAVTATVDRLRITSYRKGVGEGLIAGMIAFAVLALPMATMSGGGTQQMSVLAISIAEHLAYGAVLGAVTAALVLDAQKKRARAMSEGVFTCRTCQLDFSSAGALDDHIRSVHHGVAA